MDRKAVSGIMLTLLLASILMFAFNIQQVKASGTIYIKADGSVEGTTHITSVDNLTYTFTDNIYDEIVVEKDNIVVDGAGYVIQGTGGETGILIQGDRYYPVRESNVTIKNIRIEAFQFGIQLVHSSKVNISRTTITENNFIGIYLYNSHTNTFSENNVTGNGYGVELVHSGNNTFKANNVVNNNWQALTLLGNTIWDFIQNIDTSNTVNGKPVYYWVNQRDKLVPNDAGYVALVNCSRILVQNLTFYRSGQGVLLAGTYDSVVENVVMSADNYGIYMVQSNNITIRNNNITNCNMAMDLLYSHGNHIVENNIISNRYGIEISWSTNNIISRNIIGYTEAPNGWGVSLAFSAEGNSISGNNITNNVDGIRLYKSSNSSIFHNNFVNNTNQVYTHNSVNVWDDGYPSGGNYWSDYSGVDLYSGLYQNETGSDRIGDTPYIIDENNQDNYPLMEPWIPKPPGPIEATQELIETIETWNLSKGIENSLTSKLDNFIHLLDKGNEKAANHKLTALVNQVEALRGKKLTGEQADYVISEAQRIIDLIEALTP